MQIPISVNINEYDYNLPNEYIAQYPVAERDTANLLVYKQGHIETAVFRDITQQLPVGSTLVFNNTKVIRARFMLQKSTGAIIEVFCLSPSQPADMTQALQTNGRCEWLCMVGNLKKWKNETLTQLLDIQGNAVQLNIEQTERTADGVKVLFEWDDTSVVFSQILEAVGHIPLPPYMHRRADSTDSRRYQTVYSLIEGSVAAPTAGLHFTPELLQTLQQQGTQLLNLTLNVGAGTFLPVKTDDIAQHNMHAEHFSVPTSVLEKLLTSQNIVAVGTTSARTLESIYWLGVKLVATNTFSTHLDQWEAYQLPQHISLQQSFEALLQYAHSRNTDNIKASTSLIVVPSYKFRVLQGLVTNFHQPRSTLLLLVAALVGNDWKKIYDYALSNRFRFLSYGDSSLLLP